MIFEYDWDPKDFVVISGGQNGVDLSALDAARDLNIATGGYMPLGFKTLDGNKPEYSEKYNMIALADSSYKTRTWKNAELADFTLQIASVFTTAGEVCTLKGIHAHNKKYYPVNTRDLSDAIKRQQHIDMLVETIMSSGVTVLNVAGNSERTAPGIYQVSYEFLTDLFKTLIK